MKKIILLLILVQFVYSCKNDKFLKLKPLTQLGVSPEFWEKESNLKTFSNSFYDYIDGHVITRDFASDNCEHIVNPPPIRLGIYTIPTDLGSGGWSWTHLRNINYFIGHVRKSNIEADIKSKYLGLARFFRGWFYFKKVKQFGDVPWYSGALSTDDSAKLYKPRDPRRLIVDSILNDINYSIEHLDDKKYKNRISKWTALALKSRICLFEGTWRKYHTEANLPNADNLLRECAKASKQLIDASVYAIHSTGDPNFDYWELFQAKDAFTDEVILARSSDKNDFYYTPLFTSTSNGNYGATRSFISTYLMKDGTPFDVYYPNKEKRDTMHYYKEFQNRDPRLYQSIVFPGYIRVGTDKVSTSDFAENRTGYMIMKRVGPPIEDQGGGYRDRIIIRYAEVLLNYAEAKAELGIITQNDLDISINKIRDRVGIPHMNIAYVNAHPASYLESEYLNVRGPNTGVILEIRRERRHELAFEGFRPDDLRRWKEGHLFRTQYEGIYIKGVHKYIDLDHNGSFDLYVLFPNETPPADQIPGVQYFRLSKINGLSEGDHGRIIPYDKPLPTFHDWEYLNPIPRDELTLNSNLEQNLGWE